MKKISRRTVLCTIAGFTGVGLFFPKQAFAAGAKKEAENCDCVDTYVNALSWCPDGKKIAVSYNQHGPAIVEAGTDKIVIELIGDDAEDNRANLQQMYNGRTVVRAPNSKRMSLANPLVRQNEKSWNDVSWSPKGKKIAAARGLEVVIFNSDTGRSMQALELPDASPLNNPVVFPGAFRYAGLAGPGAGDISWSPDGEKLAFSGMFGTLLFDPDSARVLRKISFNMSDTWSLVSWSPDGRLLAICKRAVVHSTSPCTLCIVDANSGDTVWRYAGVEWPWSKVAWSPNGDRICFTTVKKRAIIIDTTNWVEGASFPKAEAVEWSPVGDHICTVTPESGAVVYEAKTGRKLDTFSSSVDPFYEIKNGVIAWRPDGKQIAIGREEYDVRFWTPKLG